MSTPDEEASRAADDAALAAAEALAEKATLGGWKPRIGVAQLRIDGKYAVETGDNAAPHIVREWRDDQGRRVTSFISVAVSPNAADDAAFIAAAREGWPEAVAIARQLQAENAELRETIARLDARVVELENRRIVTCVFCGHPYPKGTAAAKQQLLYDHVAVCEKHPARTFRERAQKAEAELAAARETIARLDAVITRALGGSDGA